MVIPKKLMGGVKMRLKEREADELILLTREFLAFARNRYENKEITEQEYRKLVCKKLSLINSIENELVF